MKSRPFWNFITPFQCFFNSPCIVGRRTLSSLIWLTFWYLNIRGRGGKRGGSLLPNALFLYTIKKLGTQDHSFRNSTARVKTAARSEAKIDRKKRGPLFIPFRDVKHCHWTFTEWKHVLNKKIWAREYQGFPVFGKFELPSFLQQHFLFFLWISRCSYLTEKWEKYRERTA